MPVDSTAEPAEDMNDSARKVKATARIVETEKIRISNAQQTNEEPDKSSFRRSTTFKSNATETAQEKLSRFKTDGEKWIRDKLKLRLTQEREALAQLKAERRIQLEQDRQDLLLSTQKAKEEADRVLRAQYEKKQKFDEERAAKEEKERVMLLENLRLIKIENDRIKAEKLRAEATEEADRKAKSLAIKARIDEAEKIRIKLAEIKLDEEDKAFYKRLELSAKSETPFEKKKRFKAEGERWITEKIGQRSTSGKSGQGRDVEGSGSVDASMLSLSGSADRPATDTRAPLTTPQKSFRYLADQDRRKREESARKISLEKIRQVQLENERFMNERIKAGEKHEMERKQKAKEARLIAEEAERAKARLAEVKAQEIALARKKQSVENKATIENAQEKKRRFKLEGEKWIKEKYALQRAKEREAAKKVEVERRIAAEAERCALLENEAKMKVEAEKNAREENKKRLKLNEERLLNEETERQALKERQKALALELVAQKIERSKADARKEAERRLRSQEAMSKMDEEVWMHIRGATKQGHQAAAHGGSIASSKDSSRISSSLRVKVRD